MKAFWVAMADVAAAYLAHQAEAAYAPVGEKNNRVA
jgi:hypothetical protein